MLSSLTRHSGWIVLSAAWVAVVACSMGLAATPGEAAIIAAVPAFLVYVALFGRRSALRVAWRHLAYFVVLGGLVTAYLLALARVTPLIRIRWSELFAAMYFLAALHIIIWSLDRLVNLGLSRALCPGGRGPSRIRRLTRTTLRVAILLLLGGPLAAAALMTHWIKFDETTDPQKLYGLAYESVGFEATDGVRIRGWYMPAANPSSDSCAILAPGRGMTKACFLPYAKMLSQANCGVLMLDLRGEGRSDGHSRGFGVLESNDVLGAVRYLQQRHPRQARYIFAFGVSQGASAVIAAAGTDSRIQAVVADSAFPSAATEIEKLTAPLPWPLDRYFRDATLLLASGALGRDLFQAGAQHDIGGISPRPVLLVHGSDDQAVSTRATEQLYAAAGDSAMLWTVPGAGHAQAIVLRGGDYAEVVRQMFKHVRYGLPAFQWAAQTPAN